MKLKNKLIGAVSVAIAAALWGVDGTILTPQLYNLSIPFVVFLLHLIPSLLMLPFFRFPKLAKEDVKYFVLIGLFGGAIGTLAIVKSLFLVDFNHLSVVILLQKLQPVFAIILAAVLLREKLSKRFIGVASIAIISSYLLTFGFRLPVIKENPIIVASFFALLAAFSFAIGTVIGKKVLYKYSFGDSTYFRFTFTTIIMALYVAFFDTFAFTQVTRMNWIIILLIAFTTGGGAIFLYYYGLKKIRASLATILELFFPLTAILLDYFVNDSTLSIAQWFGAIILVGSVTYLSLYNTKRDHSSD